VAFSRNLWVGLFFVATGVAFASMALLKLPIGTAAQMGPGYYPILLSILLVGLGGAIVFGFSGESEDPGEMIGLRSFLLVAGAPIIFALTIRSLGFLPAIFLSVFAASLADRSATFLQALTTAVGLTIFCVAVFSYGIEVPYPLIAY
jgi:hypothetical protein